MFALLNSSKEKTFQNIVAKEKPTAEKKFI